MEILFAPATEGERCGIVRIEANDSPLNEGGADLSHEEELPSSSLEKDSGRGEREVVQVLPNPLRAEGHIVLDMQESEEIRVELFDIGGERIEMIFEGVMGKGEHRLPINMRPLNAGIYICIVQIAEKQYHHVFTRGL